MNVTLSQQLRDLVQRAEVSEEELRDGKLQIRALNDELLDMKQLVEYWKKQATAKQVDAVPRLILDNRLDNKRHTPIGGDNTESRCRSTTQASVSSHRIVVTELYLDDRVGNKRHIPIGVDDAESRCSMTLPSISSHRTVVAELYDAIDELYALPQDLPEVLVMMDNILKCRKYYQSLWLDAAFEVTRHFGHWTKLRLLSMKLQADPAVAWHDGHNWAPKTIDGLKSFTSVLVALQEEFEALCGNEQLSPYRSMQQL
jgi:hypothetical protein